MATDEARLENLTVYLAKVGLENLGDTIKEPEHLLPFEIVDSSGRLGTLYVEPRSSSPPRWGRFFLQQVDPSDLGRVSSTAAVLHVVVDGRTMLLTFGQGRFLLRAVQCSQLTLHLDSASSPARAAAYLSWLNVLA